MKNILLVLLVASAFCLVLVVAAGAQHNGASFLAKHLTLQSTPHNYRNVTIAGTEKTSHGEYTLYSIPDKTVFYVNNETHKIERVDVPFDGIPSQTPTISQETAQRNAWDILQNYSLIQNRAEIAIPSVQLMDHGSYQEYAVEFRQISNGVTLPSRTIVLLNPSDGSLQSFMSINIPVNVVLTPAITEEQAVQIASDNYPGIQVVSHETNLEVVSFENGAQNLVFRITLVGEPVNGIPYGGYLAVDAMDGKVRYNSPFL